ncbi:sigma 54-interacting transcriptional regulator [Paenibacillus validus]|uniref:AAA domain-containing protein n=1 Tax=Paenibacillus validus TaxID=44253 RepID=A0A7X2Z9G7_9BACL|nr:sigma 54-interacting transcriptional regulator [Paenibacillus validus]MED4601898.1 sigma 54-interacting transcriptional regulator [Paenibacillus validus]MED4606420.1 sigma 54-interacting transcriptional regulator [Paenibacillus validus]MUG70058.1 AAA domain-containing protein [Paenibacillus validus]
MSTVIFTSPYHEMTVMAHKVAKELKLEMTIVETALDEAVEMVRPFVHRDGDAILVSRGATANLLEKEFPAVKLLRAESTEFDVICVLHEAKKTGKRTGLLWSKEEEMRYKLDHLIQIIGMEVSYYFFENSLDFAYQVDRAKYDGMEIMIGGGLRGKQMCAERGIGHINVIPGLSTIQQVLARVCDILHTRAKEKQASEFIQTVIDLSHEGIIAIDEHEQIVVFNPKAAQFFGVQASEVLYKKLTEIHESARFGKLFGGPVNSLEEIQEISGITLLVNRASYMVTGENKGIVVTFRDATQIQESEQRIRRKLYSKGLVAKYTFDDILYTSVPMNRLIQKAKKYAHVDCNALIIGESGTGKELMAQSLHNAHPERKNGPFVAVNCAALNDQLLESELFGYEPGMFTGAQKQAKPGLFELAHGGTIFLDEIGKVSMDLQDKLLRVIQEREIRRIGGERNIPIDVRVIAAVNDDIHELIEKEKFRSDLYYRLEVLVLPIPPLRDRIEDIPDLVNFMLKKYALKYGKRVAPLREDLIRQLCAYNWPGNLRQMENIVERCMVMADNSDELSTVLIQNLQDEFGRNEVRQADPPKVDQPDPADSHTLAVTIGTMDDMQRSLVKQLLERREYTKTQLAKKLGISRTTLWKLLQEGDDILMLDG